MRASGYEKAAQEWYVEPSWAVEALLDAEPLHGTCLDPFCGAGTIPKVLRANGIPCDAADLVDRSYGRPGVDFFTSHDDADNLVTNPPFSRIEELVPLALERVHFKVCILARLALLEGIERRDLMRRTPLARVWVSSRRISMPPGDSNIEAKSGAIAYAWFIWDRYHRGAPTIDWLDPRWGAKSNRSAPVNLR